MDVSQFVHSLLGGHLGCSQLLAVTDKTAMYTCVQVFVRVCVNMCVLIYSGQCLERNGQVIR